MSYSTRLDPSQRECVEAAAQLKKWSPAKLIREAAVTRAAHILNASSGPNRARLQELARVVVGQVLDPAYTVSEGESVDERTADHQYSYLEPSIEDEFFGLTVLSVTVHRPPDLALGEIKEALRTCATEFVELLLEEWKSSGRSPAYEPQVDVGRLLGDSETQRSPEEPGVGEVSS